MTPLKSLSSKVEHHLSSWSSSSSWRSQRTWSEAPCCCSGPNFLTNCERCDCLSHFTICQVDELTSKSKAPRSLTVVPLVPVPVLLLCPSSRCSWSRILVSEEYHVRVSHVSVNPACHVSKWMKSWHLAWLSGIQWSQAISLRIDGSQVKELGVYWSQGTSDAIAWYWYRRSSLRLDKRTELW